ncbi:MAG TPA: DUF2845 domain-containing protein [Gammaproteobacteria bacterium]
MTRQGRRRFAALLAAAGLLAIGAEASADALRCGSHVISRGDHAVKVLRYCGEPIAIQSRLLHRRVSAFGSFFHPGLGLLEEVLIEEWTYNFGPARLMRQVQLENGFVREVRELGYGFREK